MNRFEKPNEAPSGASCEEKKHRGGSPRIDACRALRVFLRPSRRWNRGGFESGSRRREGQRIKKLRPPGLRVITAEQHLPLLNRPHRRGQFFKGRTAPRHLAALAFAVSRPFGNRSPNRTCRSFGQTAETDGCRSAFFCVRRSKSICSEKLLPSKCLASRVGCADTSLQGPATTEKLFV